MLYVMEVKGHDPWLTSGFLISFDTYSPGMNCETELFPICYCIVFKDDKEIMQDFFFGLLQSQILCILGSQ